MANLPALRLVITPAPDPSDHAATALHVAGVFAAHNDNSIVAEAEQLLRDAARAWQEVA